MLSYFEGLRHTEIMDLCIEKTVSVKEGIYITHQRAKQRSDKTEACFLVPRAKSGEFCKAALLGSYLLSVREDLGKVTGRMLWTGKHDTFVCIPLGKNMVAKVSYILYLNKMNCDNMFCT